MDILIGKYPVSEWLSFWALQLNKLRTFSNLARFCFANWSGFLQRSAMYSRASMLQNTSESWNEQSTVVMWKPWRCTRNILMRKKNLTKYHVQLFPYFRLHNILLKHSLFEILSPKIAPFHALSWMWTMVVEYFDLSVCELFPFPFPFYPRLKTYRSCELLRNLFGWQGE